MKVAAGNNVKIEVELRVKGGEIIESSARTGPVQYTQGEGKLLPGLEKRIEGMAAGEEKQGEIPAREAFGVEEALPTKEIPRKEFPKDAKLEAGLVFQAKGPQGEPVNFKVVKVGADQVTVRFMHPLVGKDLQFKVKILMIDDPKTRKREVTIPPVPAEALLNPDDIKSE